MTTEREVIYGKSEKIGTFQYSYSFTPWIGVPQTQSLVIFFFQKNCKLKSFHQIDVDETFKVTFGFVSSYQAVQLVNCVFHVDTHRYLLLPVCPAAQPASTAEKTL